MGNAKLGACDKGLMDGAAWLRAGLLLLLVLLAGCSREPPEARLRAALGDMQAALEERNAGRFMDYVAADFVGNGGIDRDALQQMVRAQLLLNQKVGLVMGPVEVEMGEGRAPSARAGQCLAGDHRMAGRRRRLEAALRPLGAPLRRGAPRRVARGGLPPDPEPVRPPYAWPAGEARSGAGRRGG